MRFLVVGALLLAVGCGGGSGSSMQSAALSGTVYEVDGQTSNLSGVQVTLVGTGQRAYTNAAGSFSFGGLAPGTYRLNFNTTLMALAMEEGPGEGGFDGDDDEGEVDGDEGEGDEGKFEDGDDDDGDEMEATESDEGVEDEDGNIVVEVPEGGDVKCDVALKDGKVKDFSADKFEAQAAWSKLFLTDAGEIAGYHAAGSILLLQKETHTVFKVVVEGLHPGDTIEVFLGGDAPQSIGTATASDGGRAALVIEDSIPLGLPHLGELAGMLVQVKIGDLVLLKGEVPAFHEEHDGDDGEHDGDDADGEHDGDDEPHDGIEPGDDEHHDGDEPDHDGDDEEGHEGGDGVD